MKKTLLSSAAATLLFGLAACGTGDTPVAEEAATAETETNEISVIEADKRPVFYGNESGNIAVSGYDVTSYFAGEGVPVKGSEEFSVQYGDAVYQFASAENKAEFVADPAAFVPQYGGHCAWAMSNGRLAPGDPTLYKIEDGKLYLNFNKDVQTNWLKDIPGYLEKSEAAWPTIADDASVGNQA